MNKCIYLKCSEGQKFLKQEHIFPAGIGGIQKLPRGYVCDYVNGYLFSKMELNFMHESILAIPRMLVGPGKRGSLSIKKESKSKISIFISNNEPKNISLGYIKKGKPYTITQLSCMFNGDSLKCSLIFEQNKAKKDICIKEGVKFLENFRDDSKFIKVIDKDIKEGEFILGIYNKKYYIATNNKNIDLNYIKEKIQKFIIEVKKNRISKEVSEEKIKANLELKFNIDEFLRVSAKIVFNYLAFKKGQEFVLDPKFDEIRDYILGKNKNKKATIIKEKINININFPEQSHRLFIIKVGKLLIGVISFYDEAVNVVVNLCDNYEDYLDKDINFYGYICDWKNKKEYEFFDLSSSLNI